LNRLLGLLKIILFYIKELEHDVARKPLTLFGIML